jgi:hypothetical protein
VSVRQLYDGSDRPDSDSLERHRSRGRSSDSVSTPSAPPTAEPSAAPRCLQSLLIQGGGAQMFMCPLSQEGAMGQTRPLQRPEEQPPSGRGRTLPP